MIIKRAYWGDLYAYRAYYHGQIIWDFITPTSGALVSSLLVGNVLPDVISPAPISFKANMSYGGEAAAELITPLGNYVETIARTQWLHSVIPHTADAHDRKGRSRTGFRDIGMGWVLGIQFGEGYSRDALRTMTYSHHADAHDRNSYSKTGIYTNSSFSYTEDVLKIYQTYKGAFKSFAYSQYQDIFHYQMYSVNKPLRCAALAAFTDVTDADMVAMATGTGAGHADLVPARHVTFMSGDKVIHQESVPDGYDCPDPVLDRTIPTPTKTKTAQYTFEYSGGWSLTDDGEPVEGLLENVTEDIVVYATFEKHIRYYIASFYVDGELHSTQEVAYGDSATPPEVEKDGFVIQWAPTDMVIVGDTSFYGTWKEDAVLPKQELTFTYDTLMQVYQAQATGEERLVRGTDYIIEWDSVKYVCTAQLLEYALNPPLLGTHMSMDVGIGNAKIITYFVGMTATPTSTVSITNEPFLIGLGSTGLDITIRTLSNLSTHTVSIHKA